MLLWWSSSGVESFYRAKTGDSGNMGSRGQAYEHGSGVVDGNHARLLDRAHALYCFCWKGVVVG